MNVLEVKNLHKAFGEQKVLTGAGFSLKKGVICGLRGDNGCGKSVLMKCICGLLPCDRGEVILFGQPVKARKKLKEAPGVLIEHPGFIENMDAYFNLRYLAGIQGKIGREDIFFAL